MSSDKVRYNVQGMKCDGCVASAREALQQLPGYVDAEFDLGAGTMVIEGRVDPVTVIETLGGKGYTATLA